LDRQSILFYKYQHHYPRVETWPPSPQAQGTIHIEDKIFLIVLAGSHIYHLRGFDPDDDPLRFGVRDQVGNEILRIENVRKNEADVFLKKELDREVM
jgi:hypothetical protein